MSYLVLARKYRPSDFEAVSGQEHVTRTLSNAIKRNKIPHAVLLTGPRGVGKTSIARIFSKALNCVNGPTAQPCLKCVNCEEITQGRSLAVQEIDGASHNSVDNVRELIETFRSLPAPGYRFKIYIIDEVHMLSTAAFNALLKSLEEPPPHTVFILATTEAHKIPETVISRCQRHDLRALGVNDIRDQLQKISEKENLPIAVEAIGMIARLADGSMRDAQSLLDRLQSFCDGEITAKEAGQVLGMVEKRVLRSLSEAVFRRDPAAVLSLVADAFASGLDISVFLKEFVQHWRELLVAKFGGEGGLKQIGVMADDSVELRRQVEGVDGADLQDLVHIAREGCDLAIRSSQPKFALEALLVRMASREKVRSLAQIIESIKGASSAESKNPQVAHSSPAPGKASVQKSQPRIEAVNSGRPLEWVGFVKYAMENCSKMLAEYIKRIEIQSFAPGELKARGPEFSVKALEKGEYREKLLEALRAFSSCRDWNLSFATTQGEESLALSSVAQQEKRLYTETVADKKRNISEHPQIKNLQKMFPGSAIENIKIKD